MKKWLTFIATLLSQYAGNAQNVGIGTVTPNNSAQLEISSTSKGLLPPRMTTIQRNAIVSPAIGLVVFNLDDQCTDIFDGINWIKNCGLKKGPSVLIAGNVWVKKENFGGSSRYNGVGFSIGDKGYIGTGQDINGFKKDLWEYDPATNAWTQKADLGGIARSYAIAFSIGTKGYVGTGYSGAGVGVLKDFWEYNPAANTWTLKDSLGGGPRYEAVGFSIGSKGYIGTGNTNTGVFFNDFWEYDPTANGWTQKASMGAITRRLAFGFGTATKGYIGSGFNCCNPFNDFWEFDPATNTWTQKANFAGTGRGSAVSFSIAGNGYVGTGTSDNGVYLKDFWEYNTTTNVWTQKAKFEGVQRLGAAGFSIGDNGYIGTGTDFATHKNDFWEYHTQPFNVNSYSTVSNVLSQSNIADGIWSKTVINDITSTGDKFKISANGKVGIDLTSTPSFPITLNDSLGDKISLKGNLSDHFGFGVQNQLLQIHSENSTSDIAFGYGGSSNFTERMRIKGNGNVGIGTTSSTSSSAILDISSTNKGVLIPRLTTGQRNAIPTPVIGLAIFNLDDQCIDIFDGSAWIKNCGIKQIDSSSIPGNNWIQRTTLTGSARSEAISFSINGKGYVGMGFSTTQNDLWEYNAATNAWSQKANFTGPTPRIKAVGFAIGAKGYVGTGFSGSIRYNDFWEYNPASNTWVQVANFGGTPRESASGFSIGTKGYVGTGWDGNYRNDMWEFDPALNNWTQKANFGGTARWGATAFAIGSKGYLTTGFDGNTKNDIWEFDPILNNWTQRPNLPGVSRYKAVAFNIGTKGYIGTGTDIFGNNKNDFWEFDPAVSGYWTQKPDFLGTARSGASGFSIGNSGYIVSGFDNNHKNDLWQFNTQPVNVASYSTLPANLGQYNISDGIWTKLASNDIFSTGNKINISPSGNFGIGVATPVYPLQFSNSTGDKISLYGPAGKHFGLGVQSGLLQIHSDSSLSDIAFGFGSSSNFTEAMRIKGNGSIGIGTTTPNSSAALEISSTAKGMLIPRMSTLQRNAIATPVVGLTILNTDDFCTDIFDGSGWIKNCGIKFQGDSAQVSPNNWLQKMNMSTANRTHATGMSIGSKGYIGLGYGNSVDFNDFWEYNPATNAWSQKANFAGITRVKAVAFSIGTKGYVGMGGTTPSSGFVNEFWEYDPAANTWTQKANFAGGAKNGPVGFAIGPKGYIGTGYFSNTYTTDFWEYNPGTNLWTQKANLPGSGRVNATGFSAGTKGYIVSGDFNVSLLNDVWEYTPSTNTWVQKNNFPGTGRIRAVSFSIGSKGYLGTGENLVSVYKNDFWEYDPASDTWLQRANLKGNARGSAVGFGIGNKGYIGTGTIATFTFQNDFWEYNLLSYDAPSYSAIPSAISQQYNISDGKWTKTLANDLISIGDKVKIGSDGNMGIGTLSPVNKLSVNGSADFSSNVGIGTSTPGFPLNFSNVLGDKISLYGNSGAHYGFGIQGALFQIHTDAAAANIAFGYGSSTSFTERAKIFNTGEFGMTIKGRLQLTTGTQSAGLWLTNTANTINSAFIGMASDNLIGFYGSGGAQWGLTMNTNNFNVGIGINGANPAKPLSFPATLGEKILLYPGGAGEVGIGVYGNELRLHSDNPGAMVSFGTQDNAGVFTQAGRFQISSPYALYVNGSIWANGTTYASDERFKEDITPIPSPLQKLLQIEGVEYKMKVGAFPKNNFSDQRQIGLLAQNVEKIVPEAVSENDGYKGVDYARLVPLLIEAIKELKREIEILKARK